MADYLIKNIDPKVWQKARIKGIKEGVKMMPIFKELLRMWAYGEIEVKLDRT